MNSHKAALLLLVLLLLPLPGQESPPHRVVSLAPSITELVAEMGLDNRLVGISSFCNWPERIQNLPRVGGLLDLNVEQILRLQPDLVLAQPEHRDRLAALPPNLPVLVIRHRNLADVRQSIPRLARALGAPVKGQQLLGFMDRNLEAIRHRHRPGRRTPRVLLLVSRAGGGLGKPILAGPGTFLSELLELAGGKNACPGPVPYPQMGPEALMRLAPDGVVDISVFDSGVTRAERAAWWACIPFEEPIRGKRLLTVEADFWVRPGPRLVQIARKLAEFIDQLPSESGPA